MESIAKPPFNSAAGQKNIQSPQRPDEWKPFAPDGTNGGKSLLDRKENTGITGTQIHHSLLSFKSRQTNHFFHNTLVRGEKRRIHKKSPGKIHEEEDENDEEAEGEKRGEDGQKMRSKMRSEYSSK